MNVFAVTTSLLRAPEALVALAQDRRRLMEIAPPIIAILVGSAAILGAVAGSYRGGIQIGYAALKMPLLFGIPLVVGLPAIHAVYAGFGCVVPWSRLAAAGLVGAARGAVLTAALAPVLWLLYSMSLDYHVAVACLVAGLVVAGLPGLATIARAIPEARAFRLASLVSVLILGVITAQTGWVLRPFVARPTIEVTLFRPVEGDILGSLARIPLASLGFYSTWEPDRSGLLGNGLRRSRVRRTAAVGE